jgi:hypothetical protein
VRQLTARAYGTRAINELQPRVSSDSQSHPDDLLSVLYWIWFYEPADDERGGFSRKLYERPEDLTPIDQAGRGRWNVAIDDLPYGDIVRAGEHGLLRGDPLRPYLGFMQPQGGGDLQTTWEGAQLAWQALEYLLVARGALGLTAEVRQRLLDRLRGRRVAEAHSADWMARGASPTSVKRTFDCKPWSPEDLRIVMHVPTVEDAKLLLSLFGHEPTASGVYAISEASEARLLRLAEDDVFETLVGGHKPREGELESKLERLLRTGERSVPTF